MKKIEKKDKGKFIFLDRGYTSFPLRDVGKKFKIVDTIDIYIKKPKLIEFKKLSKCRGFHINHRETEEAVWKEIRDAHKTLFKEADWLVISWVSEFGEKIMVSLDMLREV